MFVVVPGSKLDGVSICPSRRMNYGQNKNKLVHQTSSDFGNTCWGGYPNVWAPSSAKTETCLSHLAAIDRTVGFDYHALPLGHDLWTCFLCCPRGLAHHECKQPLLDFQEGSGCPFVPLIVGLQLKFGQLALLKHVQRLLVVKLLVNYFVL